MHLDTFASRLGNLLREGGLTQEVFAQKLSFAQSSVSRWLKGSLPHRRAAKQIADLFEVNVEWLLTGSGLKYQEKSERIFSEKSSAREPAAQYGVKEIIAEGPEGAAKKMSETALAENLVEWSKMVQTTSAAQMKIAILANVQLFATELRSRIEKRLPRQ